MTKIDDSDYVAIGNESGNGMYVLESVTDI